MQTEANGINNGIITETGTTEMGGGLASDIGTQFPCYGCFLPDLTELTSSCCGRTNKAPIGTLNNEAVPLSGISTEIARQPVLTAVFLHTTDTTTYLCRSGTAHNGGLSFFNCTDSD